jgi:hypothetical protein
MKLNLYISKTIIEGDKVKFLCFFESLIFLHNTFLGKTNGYFWFYFLQMCIYNNKIIVAKVRHFILSYDNCMSYTLNMLI